MNSKRDEDAPVQPMPTTYIQAMERAKQGLKQGISNMDTAVAHKHADFLIRLAEDAHGREADLEAQLDLAMATVENLHKLVSGLRSQVRETRDRWAAEVAKNLE